MIYLIEDYITVLWSIWLYRYFLHKERKILCDRERVREKGGNKIIFSGVRTVSKNLDYHFLSYHWNKYLKIISLIFCLHYFRRTLHLEA